MTDRPIRPPTHRRDRDPDEGLRLKPRPPEKTDVVRNTIVVLAVLGFIVALPFIWQASPTPGKMVKRKAAPAGQALYDEFCGYCHGFKLDGVSTWYAPKTGDPVESPRLDSQGNAWKLSDKMLFNITRNGGQAYATPGTISKMPAFAGVITDPEIRATLAYIASRWTDEIHAMRPSRNK